MAYIERASSSVGEELAPRPVRARPSDGGYFWAGESLTFQEACKHFVTIGATGTGKSVTLNMLLQSVLMKMGGGDGVRRRALVYDPKADLVNFIANYVPRGIKVRILNPMDERFAPWDIGADIRTETDALELASALIPRNSKESSPYFSDTARALLTGVIKRLIASAKPKGAWNLRDIILAFESTETLHMVLSHADTKYLLDHFRPENDRNFAGVKSTVDTALAIYRPIAALLHSATSPVTTSSTTAVVVRKDPGTMGPIDHSPVSLKRWLEDREESVLVIGNHENAREATDTMNRLLLRQLSKLLIARDGIINKDETWLFLDELREAGELSGLRQLLLRGRSKGVAVAMGFQDVEGIYAVYGKHEGAEIIGAAQNLVALHINATAPETAEWASRVFGSRRTLEASNNMQLSDSKMSTTRQMQLVPNVFPIEFTQLPMPSPEDGLRYFAYTNRYKHGRGHYDWHFLEREGPMRRLEALAPDFLNHKDADERMRLKPWEHDVFQRLQFEVLPLPKPQNKATPKPVEEDRLSSLKNIRTASQLKSQD